MTIHGRKASQDALPLSWRQKSSPAKTDRRGFFIERSPLLPHNFKSGLSTFDLENQKF